jgi:DNA-binding transcriptional ArsR family regulator
MRYRLATKDSPNAMFSAVSDPTRRAVLDLLRRGSLPAGTIAAAFPVSRPAISKHLRILRQARLVNESRRSRHRIYSLNPAPLKTMDAWLKQYRDFWEASLVSLKGVVENENTGKAPARRRRRT